MRLFIGKLGDDDVVHGERYSRVLVKDPKGMIIKDHWDKKRKAGS
jgi:hypothetical protein